MTDAIAYGALESLVKQFSSAFDCLRELVQNSIDAGSPEVDVWMDYEAGEGHGVITIQVDDFGEGMDEAIIDKQLTRLFESSKENDLTKIGKFGIGFVSVFALEPRHVLVRTGRGGQRWEVLFFKDRTFCKMPLAHPVEGTQVGLFLDGDREKYGALVTKAKAALTKWCSQAEVEVRFTDRLQARETGLPKTERINAPFEIDGLFPSRLVEDGTELLIAYDDEPEYGFYNRGLTLALTRAGEQVLDARAGRFGHIGFKMKSRWLGHTLSRETLMRDANYEKAMTLLERAADELLFPQLVAAIEEHVANPAWKPRDLERYAELARFLAREPSLARAEKRAILRGVHGEALTPAAMADVLAKDGRILVTDAPSDLTRRLAAGGSLVLLGRSEGEGSILDALRVLAKRAIAVPSARTMGGLVSKMLGQSPEQRIHASMFAPERVFFPVEVDVPVHEESAPLIDAAMRLLRKAGSEYRALGTCRLTVAVKEPPLFVVGRTLAPLMAAPPDDLPDEERRRLLEAAVNRDHPHFRALMSAWAERPALAAYCLAKGVLLDQDRHLYLDDALMRAALPEVDQ